MYFPNEVLRNLPESFSPLSLFSDANSRGCSSFSLSVGVACA